MKDDCGRSVEFVPLGVKPLTFSDLLNSKKSRADTYKLELFTNDPVINGNLHPGPATIKTSATFNEPVGVYALVDGGWVPPLFAIPQNSLMDRNVVSRLKEIRLGTQRDDLSPFDWWLQFFKEGALFNPLLYALEGQWRTTPNFEQFVSAFKEASAEISSAFPKSKVVTYDKTLYEAAYKLIKDINDQSAQETAFLLETIPRISEPVKTERRKKVEAEILDVASKRGLYHSSLIVIAVLTCLYDQGFPDSAGRRILNPCQNYSENDAYNAIADLNNLELFIRSGEHKELKSFALYTCDRALALFWCGLTPHDGHVLNDVLNFSAYLDECLFPCATEADLERLRALMR